MKLLTSSTLLSAFCMMSIALGCTQADIPQENLTNQTETIPQATDVEQTSKQTEPRPESEIVASTNRALRSGEQTWTEILPGEEAYELIFTEEGALLYQGTVLLSKVLVSGLPAKRLLISGPSPSGNYHYFQACDALDEAALCWTEFLVTKTEGSVQQVSLSKYGVMHWVQWSEDERYALFPYTSEGSFTFYALDLETGESSTDSDWFCDVDLNSFSWLDNRNFQIQVFDHGDAGGPCNDSPRWFSADMTKLFE